MIIGFSRYGTGAGRGPVQYLLDPHRKGREINKPVLLRGQPDETRELIDSLTFKHKYTSGVLSFAPGETITPKMEQDIINRFEQFAFAGLEPDQGKLKQLVRPVRGFKTLKIALSIKVSEWNN
ncbi:hypothetical protein [Swingsia samuiensis]|uniref:Uncharacterized protein n=1 Tax=Swingsia samuiensis TaxID=1293412 RepID=A0A4Y6UMX1_9PROT|nr:hypothetical protein [Swingsia samuiensis]QDH18110.1 hypothetical protein E3D00_10465 [Swingsia samuiensis]